MNNKFFLCLFFYFLFSTKAYANKNYNFFSTPYNTQVSFNDWSSHMKSSFKDSLCDNEGYIKDCYQITKNSCRSSVERYFNKCIQIYKNQKTVQPYKVGLKMGHNLGLCIGSNLHENLKLKTSLATHCE